MKTNKNYLKLKSVHKTDTGVFVCRGVNGFGSVKVRIELVVTGNFIAQIKLFYCFTVQITDAF